MLPACYAEQGLCNGRSSVCLSVCPCACLSRQPTAATAAFGCVVSTLPMRYRLTAAGSTAPALSSKCGQRHVRSRQKRLNTDLFGAEASCSCQLKIMVNVRDVKASRPNHSASASASFFLASASISASWHLASAS